MNNMQVSQYLKKKNTFNKKKEEHKQLRIEINNLKKRRELLIKSANLPTGKITFEPDQLYYITENGESVPYHLGVSEARNMEIVLKLNSVLNPKTPIFRIDKAGNIGKIWKSIEKYIKEFEKNTGKKMYVFAEKVELGQDSIMLEVLEDGEFKKFSKQPKIMQQKITSFDNDKDLSINIKTGHKEDDATQKESTTNINNDIPKDSVENKDVKNDNNSIGELNFDDFK